MSGGHQSGLNYLIVLGVIGAIALVVWLLGKFLPNKGRTATGNALMRAEAVLLPSREHVIEAKEREDKQEEADADPPNPGDPDR